MTSAEWLGSVVPTLLRPTILLCIAVYRTVSFLSLHTV